MRTSLRVALVTLALACGCAETSEIGRATRDTFTEAYDAVQSGARAVVHTGGLVLARAGEGTVSVMHKASSGARRAARWSNDRLITSKLESSYAYDPALRHAPIDVDTSNGVVTLRGQVATPEQAEMAIRRALSEPGVLAVHSSLVISEREARRRHTRF